MTSRRPRPDEAGGDTAAAGQSADLVRQGSDHAELDEIELYAEVLSAVATVDRPLTIEELDDILGLPPRPRMTIPVAIYLGTEDDHEVVERALTLVLRAFGFEVIHKDSPVRSSWFRTFIGSAKELATTPEVEKRLIKVERAIEMRLLLTDQAKIDAAQGEAVAKLLTALENTRDALTQIGSVLLIKVDGVPVVRNLSQHELAYMERNPVLFRDPAGTLQELQKIDRGEVG